jgi:hypothetical protein
MTNYTVTEIDVTTGEEINRTMTEAEIDAVEAEMAATEAAQNAIAAQAAAKVALLTKLGITAEEAALLLS